MTGIFPKEPGGVPKGPLKLATCDSCGLAQLDRNYDLTLMYGNGYGYRSGLNVAMVNHLEQIVEGICNRVLLDPGDLVIDIGSNDGTLLGCYPADLRRVGVDPTITKFGKYYQEGIEQIPEFFSVTRFRGVKAKVITSIACFYDLPHPTDFVRDVAEILHKDGIWVLEQSYLPEMIARGAYDSICHEHLEYYTLNDIYVLVKICGLKVLSVEFNDTNGGSFRVTVGHETMSRSTKDEADIADILLDEIEFEESSPFDRLVIGMEASRRRLRDLLIDLKGRNHLVFGYGASTKGNVILQYCDIGPDLLPFIAEVNEDKFGSLTPGTNIPIISEADAKRMGPHYYLVFPWHFREGIVKRERAFLEGGGKLIFPLPEVEVVG